VAALREDEGRLRQAVGMAPRDGEGTTCDGKGEAAAMREMPMESARRAG